MRSYSVVSYATAKLFCAQCSAATARHCASVHAALHSKFTLQGSIDADACVGAGKHKCLTGSRHARTPLRGTSRNGATGFRPCVPGDIPGTTRWPSSWRTASSCAFISASAVFSERYAAVCQFFFIQSWQCLNGVCLGAGGARVVFLSPAQSR